MTRVEIASWSHVLPTRTELVEWRREGPQTLEALSGPVVPRGAGRSYGDCAYVSDGTTCLSSGLDRILSFDQKHGLITCEAGVPLIGIIERIQGSGWAVQAYGGSRWVTVGGAIASDIHGKCDRRKGSFGNHIDSLSIEIADGTILDCSPGQNPDLFRATIGGMGLTGFVRSATLRLQAAPSEAVHVTTQPFVHVREMIELFEEGREDHQVAWVDFTRGVPRGIHHGATHILDATARVPSPRRPVVVPIPMIKVFNSRMMRLLNSFRYWQQIRYGNTALHVLDFHYPVDILKNWNRFYGSQGFQEYQFFVPPQAMSDLWAVFVKSCRRFDRFPFFAVVKRLGDATRQGFLSFAGDGYTMMADFENRPENHDLFSYLTDVVLEHGGRIYLAKDSYTKAEQFSTMYDEIGRWQEIAQTYDPMNRFQSDMSLRLKMKPW